MATTGSHSVKKRDPLARYFKDLDACDLESGESDEEESHNGDTAIEEAPGGGHKDTKKSNNKSSEASVSLDGENDQTIQSSQRPSDDGEALATSSNTGTSADKLNKLPSATVCLGTQTTPDFLKVSQTKEVNWDVHEKRLEDDDAVVPGPEFKSNAVPPPSSYEPQTDPGIKVVDSEGNKRKRMEDELEDQMTSTKAYKVQDSGDS